MGSFFAPQKLQELVQSFLKQGFRQSCCLCERSADREVCMDCWRQISACQQFERLPSTSRQHPLIVWGRYQGPLKRAIAQLKYQNQPILGSLLGEELGLRWVQEFPKIKSFQVVPIPLHRDRFAQRGYNQSELIAQRFAQVVGVSHLRQGLIRTRATQAQYGLAPGERQTNILGAFTVGQRLRNQTKPKPIVLIDDIFTTGTTIAEAQTVLETAQLKVLGTAVVAQALLKGASDYPSD